MVNFESALTSTRSTRGSTLLEALFVVAILALMISLVVVDFTGMIRRSRLDEDVARFSRTMRLTAEQAVLRGRDLAVVVEITDGYYTVYEANEENRYGGELEPVIAQQSLDRCYIDQTDFEDGTHQYSGELILRATPEGWATSIVLNLRGIYDRQRFVRYDRATTRVIVARQPLYLPEPQEQVYMTVPVG